MPLEANIPRATIEQSEVVKYLSCLIIESIMVMTVLVVLLNSLFGVAATVVAVNFLVQTM